MYEVALSLGRYNPPTLGHFESLRELQRVARANGVRPEVFVIEGEQSSQDKQKNPLSANQRIRILKSWFPDIHFDIAGSAYDVMEVLQVQGKRPKFWIAGTDRVKRYKQLLDYAGFKHSLVVELDRLEGKAAGVSATKARAAAANADLETFISMMPDDISRESHTQVYEIVRKALTGDGSS